VTNPIINLREIEEREQTCLGGVENHLRITVRERDALVAAARALDALVNEVAGSDLWLEHTQAYDVALNVLTAFTDEEPTDD